MCPTITVKHIHKCINLNPTTNTHVHVLAIQHPIETFTPHFLQYSLPAAAMLVLGWWSWIQSSVNSRTDAGEAPGPAGAAAARGRGHRPPARARRGPVCLHHPLLRLEPRVVPTPRLPGTGGGRRRGLVGHPQAHFFVVHFFHLNPFVWR